MDTDWRRTLERWPLPVPAFELDPKRTALLVIDMQRFCAHPAYGLGKRLTESFPELAAYYENRLEGVIGNVQRLLALFRDRGWRIIFTTFGPELPDGSDLPWFRHRTGGPAGVRRYNNFPRGTPEHEILPPLQPRLGELVINKTTTSPFTSTGFDQILHHLRITGLVVTGVSTDACVESTARDAADHGFRCIIIDDACAALEEAAHNASLSAFARLFGRVLSTEELIKELVQEATTPAE